MMTTKSGWECSKKEKCFSFFLSLSLWMSFLFIYLYSRCLIKGYPYWLWRPTNSENKVNTKSNKISSNDFMWADRCPIGSLVKILKMLVVHSVAPRKSQFNTRSVWRVYFQKHREKKHKKAISIHSWTRNRTSLCVAELQKATKTQRAECSFLLLYVCMTNDVSKQPVAFVRVYVRYALLQLDD